jgi:prophage DNA circulation protein
MDKMKFRMFRWPENPEQFGIRMVCEPLYELNSIGQYDYTGMGPMCRVYTGSGVFFGPDAVEWFNALQVMMSTRTPGELVHPVWGTADVVYLTQLQMDQESRPDYIKYSFTFREADEKGSIPWLPEYEEQT